MENMALDNDNDDDDNDDCDREISKSCRHLTTLTTSALSATVDTALEKSTPSIAG